MPNPTPAQSSEPMVTVKKADGTMVKVPLSEIRKKKLGNEEMKKVGNNETQKHENTENKLAVSGQSSAISKDQKVSQQPKSVVSSPKSDTQPQTLAEGIERMLAERQRIGQDTMIQNVRTTKATNIRTTNVRKDSEEKGNEEMKKLESRNLKLETGVGDPSTTLRAGLKPNQMSNVTGQMSNVGWHADDHKSLLDDEFHKENLPMVIEARRQALAKVRPTPLTLKHENIKALKQGEIKESEEMKKLGNEEMRGMPKSVVRSPLSVVKPMMHDVRPGTPVAEKRGLGPVDELRSFSLSDLRHLDVTPQAAGSKLMQKFETLKDESYLLYMEGVKAWRENPLYRQYQAVLRRALSARQTIGQTLGESQEREAMKLEEWGAVVKVSKDLL